MSDRGGTDAFDKLHEYAVDLKRRRVFMQTPFYPAWEDGWSDMVLRNLLWLDATPNPIELWLNTPGGSLDEMWAIYDAIRTASNPIITVATGNVSSAGCLILAAGTGTRYTTPNATVMWHGGWCGADLSPREFTMRAAFYERERSRWVATMASHTTPRELVDGRPTGHKIRSKTARVEFWEEGTHDRELWFEAKDMIANGIVDEVWTRD